MHLTFDFDGTICDSMSVYYELAEKYCLENHLDVINLDIARQLGLKGLISHYHLSPLKIARIILWGRPLLVQAYTKLPLFPGVAEVLQKLAQHHTLGLITSTELNPVLSNLKNHQIYNLFSYVDAGVDLFGKSHKLKKHPVDYYIGDETRDIEAAQKVGCKSVAVTWGFETENLLAASHPDIVAHSPADLLKLPW